MPIQLRMTNAPVYAGLTPDLILNAIDSTGLRTDGRLLALNSYENRVYQTGIEDDKPVVAKFYRPGRWSDEQILEEHAFTAQLAEREIPAVPPIPVNGKTLHLFEGFRFAVYPRRGGRAPELDDPETSFFYADPKIVAAPHGMHPFFRRLFDTMVRIALPITDELQIPAERRVELGVEVAI